MSTVWLLSMAISASSSSSTVDVLVLADGVAFDHVLVLDHVAGDGVDHLPLQAVAGGAVQRVEPDLLGGRGGWIDRDGGGDEGELEVALPVGAGCHG